mmetsp:Transcript_126853/g.218854  ORF Transcript_126853/g.218854 Transcript_126853/m.218854 type:complete len:295 (+) Transcript_126853:45-929(+)
MHKLHEVLTNQQATRNRGNMFQVSVLPILGILAGCPLMVPGMRPPEDTPPSLTGGVASEVDGKLSGDVKLMPDRIAEWSNRSSPNNSKSSLVAMVEEELTVVPSSVPSSPDARIETLVPISPRSDSDAQEEAKRQKLQDLMRDETESAGWRDSVLPSFRNLFPSDEQYLTDVQPRMVVPKLPTNAPWFAATATRQKFIHSALGKIRDTSKLMKLLSQQEMDRLSEQDEATASMKKKLDNMSAAADLMNLFKKDLSHIDDERMGAFENAKDWDALEYHRSGKASRHRPPKGDMSP